MRRLILALALFLWPMAANAEWREASSRHFVIYSEQSEAELRQFADELGRFDRALRVLLRRPDPERSPATRLTIYVMRNEDALQAFLDNPNVGGVYIPRHSGSVAFTYRGRPRRLDYQLDPRLVLFHEYTHHFLNSNFAFGAPLWFSEGFPEFWATTQIGEDGSVNYGRVGGHRSGELTYLRNIPAGRLLTLRHPIADRETFAAIYGRGWVLAHYLVFEQSRAGQLDAYLRALGSGSSPEEAARVFGDLDELERDVQRYLRRTRFSYGTLSAERVTPHPVQIRVLGPGEQAIMSVKMQSHRGVTERQARALVPEARRIGERFPNDPAVQVAVAEAEYDAGNHAQAEAAATRALAADPRNVEAHLFKARAISARLTAAGDSANPEQWREAQMLIAAANRLDPDDPEPFVAFYRSYEAADMPVPRNAVEGLYDALALAPEDRMLRMLAGRQLLRDGNADQARAVFAPLVGDAHSGRLGPLVAELIEMLNAGNTAAALSRLEQETRSNEQARAGS